MIHTKIIPLRIDMYDYEDDWNMDKINVSANNMYCCCMISVF